METNDKIKPHAYDGIQEYDNQLPRWWVWKFVFTVIFGLGYWFYYHTYAAGPNLSQELAAEAAAHQAQFQSAQSPTEAVLTLERARALQKDATAMDGAKKLFAEKCAVCHAPQGQGMIGPNLTDDLWIHGGTPAAIVATITNGVLEKGMVPWKGQLQPAEIEQTAAYILSLQGSNPPNPKAPEGTKKTGEE